ncbi:DUF3883 domain-containing protein [Pseudomonas sp. MD195_PC81_125]|uniref:DUF3883 domain-containing protein n=1 Tax=Pseudomonas sp. MD195_PC81_125 TaxID=2741560 RepID=UPI0015FBB862|nr:DUF3883 domain-containing protein [Pseudomonas sp. MD195_PC81_125]MBA5983533.1 DUF3883 domain-containing protein [Pseudomonas sp. MD195_PC81_125]
MSKIAIKRLTKSDLTLFSWHFKEMNSGNQKAINLNANVFVDELYPDLPEISAQRGKTSFLIDLSIYGPAGAPRHSLARKIVKGAAYKNWRLNGEFVENPFDSPTRYNDLREGDFAILIFGGESVPEDLKIIMVCARLLADSELHARIVSEMGAESMRAFSAYQLEEIVDHADIEESHAARVMDIAGALEDAACGGVVGVETLKKWSSKRLVSKDDLRRARDKVDITGFIGEEFVDYYLGCLQLSGDISSYRWASNENAVEAFDFVIQDNLYIDVKSTVGGFNQKIHVSINELLHMKEFANYRIYRIYGIDKKKAKLRISSPLRSFAIAILQKLDPVFDGVRVDNISVSPSILEFGDEIEIEIFSLG